MVLDLNLVSISFGRTQYIPSEQIGKVVVKAERLAEWTIDNITNDAFVSDDKFMISVLNKTSKSIKLSRVMLKVNGKFWTPTSFQPWTSSLPYWIHPGDRWDGGLPPEGLRQCLEKSGVNFPVEVEVIASDAVENKYTTTTIFTLGGENEGDQYDFRSACNQYRYYLL